MRRKIETDNNEDDDGDRQKMRKECLIEAKSLVI